MLQVVTQPMDLTTVKTRLDNSFYADLATCVGDLQQVWTNAKLYNPGHHTIHKWAEELNMITKGWVAKCHQQAAPSPPNPVPAPAAVPAAAPAPAPNEVEVNNQINLKVYILYTVINTQYSNKCLPIRGGSYMTSSIFGVSDTPWWFVILLSYFDLHLGAQKLII